MYQLKKRVNHQADQCFGKCCNSLALVERGSPHSNTSYIGILFSERGKPAVKLTGYHLVVFAGFCWVCAGRVSHLSIHMGVTLKDITAAWIVFILVLMHLSWIMKTEQVWLIKAHSPFWLTSKYSKAVLFSVFSVISP